MPVTSAFCPLHREQVDWDHFNNCEACPPWLAGFISVGIMSDTRHASLQLTATRTMGCSRQLFIEHHFPYAVDPMKRWLMSRGTALHGIAAHQLDENIWMTEKTDKVALTLVGTLFGGPISAVVDVLRRDLTEIADYKFPNDFSAKWRSKNGIAKLEHAIQLNIMRLLLGQQQWAIDAGYDENNVKLTLWDHAGTPARLEAPAMTEEEMLRAKPFGGDYTVEEIIAWNRHIEGLVVTGEKERRRQASLIPLVGVEMMNGKKCPEYCEVSAICGDLVREFGAPEVVS